MSEYFRLVWSTSNTSSRVSPFPFLAAIFCVTWEYILLIKNKQNIFFPPYCSHCFSLQQNCCKVSDYQLVPTLKENPYIYNMIYECQEFHIKIQQQLLIIKVFTLLVLELKYYKLYYSSRFWTTLFFSCSSSICTFLWEYSSFFFASSDSDTFKHIVCTEMFSVADSKMTVVSCHLRCHSLWAFLLQLLSTWI